MGKTSYILVGLPASGKSTYISNNAKEGDFVASTDNWIEQKAKELGSTYTDMFLELIKEATDQVNLAMDLAIVEGKTIFVDQTNLVYFKRANLITRLSAAGYKVDCVFFMPPKTQDDLDLWKTRLLSRPGKVIPELSIFNMLLSFQEPRLNEGYDAISYLDLLGAVVKTKFKDTEKTSL